MAEESIIFESLENKRRHIGNIRHPFIFMSRAPRTRQTSKHADYRKLLNVENFVFEKRCQFPHSFAHIYILQSSKFWLVKFAPREI